MRAVLGLLETSAWKMQFGTVLGKWSVKTGWVS